MTQLLEKKMQDLKLDDKEKDIMRTGLNSNSFRAAAKETADLLRRRGKFDQASQLIDFAPLFDVHDFWQYQPVPKINEKVDKSALDKPIEIKCVDDV